MNDQNNAMKINQENLTLDKSTALALTRTRLAAERTLMSWIRTSFSMISFGFTILKFFQYLQSINPNPQHTSGSKDLGVFLILLGISCLIPGMIEHRRQLNILHALDRSSSRWSYAFIVAILVGIMGLYTLANALAIHLNPAMLFKF